MDRELVEVRRRTERRECAGVDPPIRCGECGERADAVTMVVEESEWLAGIARVHDTPEIVDYLVEPCGHHAEWFWLANDPGDARHALAQMTDAR